MMAPNRVSSDFKYNYSNIISTKTEVSFGILIPLSLFWIILQCYKVFNKIFIKMNLFNIIL